MRSIALRRFLPTLGLDRIQFGTPRYADVLPSTAIPLPRFANAAEPQQVL
jgi:hypothetical protein